MKCFSLKKKNMDQYDGIIKNNFKFNIWTYARVDTVRKKLKRFKKAGVNWLV